MIALAVLSLFFAFSSFAFGCMEGWSIGVCEVLLLGGVALAGWRDRSLWCWPRRLGLPALFVAALAGVGLLQLVPLPAGLWRACRAERVAIYDEGDKAEALLRSDAYRWDAFSSAPAPPARDASPALTPAAPGWIPASFTPLATVRSLLALAAAFCLILLLERVARDEQRLQKLLFVVGGLGLAVALVALVQYAEPKSKLLGIRASPFAYRAFGPFVNPNHGEAFVNLTLPLLYYLLWRRSLREAGLGNRWGLRALMAGIFILHVVLLAFSHSRGAFLALALYPLAILGHWAFKGSRAAWTAVVLYALVLAAGVFFALATGAIFESGRVELNANVPARHFLIGQGLGSFEARFPAVVTDFPLAYTTKVNTHLEDEYLQTFFEAGLLPALLLLAAAGWALVLALRGVRLGRASFWLAPALAGETAHAAVDFTGHVFPVVGAYLLLWLMLSRLDAKGEHRGRHHGRADRPSAPLPADAEVVLVGSLR